MVSLSRRPWNRLLNHDLADVVGDLVVLDVVAVLSADYHAGNALDRSVGPVLDRHLALAIGPQVFEGAVLAYLSEAAGDVVSVLDRRRHQLGRLLTGVAEHHALVPRTADVHAPGNVG